MRIGFFKCIYSCLSKDNASTKQARTQDFLGLVDLLLCRARQKCKLLILHTISFRVQMNVKPDDWFCPAIHTWSTFICDHLLLSSSDFVNQTTDTEDALEAKHTFKEYATAWGIFTKHYHADNFLIRCLGEECSPTQANYHLLWHGRSHSIGHLCGLFLEGQCQLVN